MRKKKTLEPLPLTLKCPIGGEEWPATSLKSLLDTTRDKLTYGGITFECPAHQFFTLSRAVRDKVFTRAQANHMLEYTQKGVTKYRKLPPEQVFPFLEKKLNEAEEQAGW